MDCDNCPDKGFSGNSKVCGILLQGGETAFIHNNKISERCPKDETEVNFISSFNNIANEIHDTANKNGFWDDDVKINQLEVDDNLKKILTNIKNGNMISLMHSELSEALEAIRIGNPPDNKIPEFKSATVELADCVIRIMDFASARNLRLGEAIIAKIKYNKTRPFKHGKEF